MKADLDLWPAELRGTDEHGGYFSLSGDFHLWINAAALLIRYRAALTAISEGKHSAPWRQAREALSDDLEVCETCHGRRFYSRNIPGNEGVPEYDADDQPCPDCNPNGEGVAP